MSEPIAPTHRRSLPQKLRRWWWAQRGASAVEYIIALILCALVILGVVRLFGTTIYEKFQQGDERISGMEGDGPNRRNRSGGDSKGDLVSASGASEAGESRGGSGGGKGTIRSRDGLASRSGAHGAGDREQGRGGNARHGGSTFGYDSQYGSSEEDRERRARGEDRIISAKDRARYHAISGEEVEEELHFNPFILIILALMLLFLGFMIIKLNKGGPSED